MASRSKFSYDPFALPLPRKRRTLLKVLTFVLVLAVVIVLAITAWTLLAPMLLHTTSAPMPFSNPAPAQHPLKHW